ncbi:MAG: hypothetical protein K8S54_03270 [Spirochaetia bacterium]|nr:hypothetical protein [Spirochaetia bacterium]
MRALILCLGLLLLVSCQKDPDPTPQKLTAYLVLCGAGVQACYTSCGARVDYNNNGIVDASETYDFKNCTNLCDSNCSLTFLITALSK